MSFFSKNEGKSLEIGTKQVLSCPSCGLANDARTPKMKPYGEGRKKILIIGSCPSSVDDHKGKPWQDKQGRMLKRILKAKGIDLFTDCVSVNAISCPVPADTYPSNHQISCCRKRVWRTIKRIQPKVIIALGQDAMESLLAHRWRSESIGSIYRWRGWQIPDRSTLCWICPTFSVSQVMNADNHGMKTVWSDDLDKAIDKSAPDSFFLYEDIVGGVPDDVGRVQLLPQTDEADKILMDFYKTKPELIAFDYETTGLKPHAQGHEIYIASVATGFDCFSFVYPYGFKALKRILRSKHIGKIAHNMKFETNWTRVILKYSVNNWAWDSMISSRIMSNERGINSLKFQTYVRMGVPDYDSEINQYLKGSDNKDANSFNRIKEAPLKKLMTYCGLDSLYTYQLAIKHRHTLNPHRYR